MSRSDLEFEQREQAQWWEDYRQDQDAMQQAQEDAMREQITEEMLAEIVPQLHKVMAILVRRAARIGFGFGFATALTGAVVFIYFA